MGDLDHRGDAVRRAARARDDLWSPVWAVDAMDHGGDGVRLRRRREDQVRRAGLDMPLQVFAGGEDSGAFQDEVDAEVVPRQVRRVTLGERRDPSAVDDQRALSGSDLAGVATRQALALGGDRGEVAPTVPAAHGGRLQLHPRARAVTAAVAAAHGRAASRRACAGSVGLPAVRGRATVARALSPDLPRRLRPRSRRQQRRGRLSPTRVAPNAAGSAAPGPGPARTSGWTRTGRPGRP